MGWREHVQVLSAPLQPALIERCAELMRASDVEEVRASTHQTPLEHLREALAMSTDAYALLYDGSPMAIGGVIALEGNRNGSLWFLTTEEADRHKRRFVLVARDVLWFVRQYWFTLSELVDARYFKALRFLKYLGAEIGPAEPFGPEGVLFHSFTFRRA